MNSTARLCILVLLIITLCTPNHAYPGRWADGRRRWGGGWGGSRGGRWTVVPAATEQAATPQATTDPQKTVQAPTAVSPISGAPPTTIAQVNNPIVVAPTDSGRYPHRGFMLDTARKFFSVATIKKLIDAMQAARMNVFHWHFMDNEAQSIAYAQGQCGATVMSTGGSYSSSDVAGIIAYAAARGIAVVPEFEFPGHTQVWERCVPQLMASEAGCGQLDISKPGTADVVKQFVMGVNAMFKTGTPHAVHIGVDEVAECWDNWRAGLLADFEGQMIQWLSQAGPTVIIAWADVLLDAGVALDPTKVALQVWRNEEDLQAVLGKGYRAIVSTASTWYVGNSEVETIEAFKFPQSSSVMGGELVWFTSAEDDENVEWVKPLIQAAGDKLYYG